MVARLLRLVRLVESSECCDDGVVDGVDDGVGVVGVSVDDGDGDGVAVGERCVVRAVAVVDVDDDGDVVVVDDVVDPRAWCVCCVDDAYVDATHIFAVDDGLVLLATPSLLTGRSLLLALVLIVRIAYVLMAVLCGS